MKAYLLVLAAVVACASANTQEIERKAKIQKYTSDCIKESGVKPELLNEAKNGHLSEDESFKKFLFCYFQKAGIVTSDAKLNTDVALAKLPADVDKVSASKLLDECKTKKGTDHSDTTFEIFKCFAGTTKKFAIFF